MPRKRRDAGVQVEGVAADPVTFQVASDPMSIKDRAILEILLETVAATGKVTEGHVETAVTCGNLLAKHLGWK